MYAADAWRSSDKTIVLPKPVKISPLLFITVTVLCRECKVFHHTDHVILSNLCLIYSSQEVVKAKVKSDINKDVQPGRGAQSTLRKEVTVG
jgi:hypothetical protein